jgi:ABC-type uncharacterized transport system YnjBCD ATPase subunit
MALQAGVAVAVTLLLLLLRTGQLGGALRVALGQGGERKPPPPSARRARRGAHELEDALLELGGEDDEEALLAAAPLLGPALQPLLATPVAAHPALLEWRCVECWVLPGRLSRLPARKLLDGVSGRAGGGLSALLGPSGCGKTTLLELLAGRKGACYLVRGALRLNGAPTSPAQVQLASAYVPQEDVLPGTSTVWEHLAFHAALRLPPSVPAAERALRVQQTLSALGLARLAGARIGDAFQRGLSGGERRRVSIAAELLARPAMLFADEPTRCVLYAPAGTSLAPR